MLCAGFSSFVRTARENTVPDSAHDINKSESVMSKKGKSFKAAQCKRVCALFLLYPETFCLVARASGGGPLR